MIDLSVYSPLNLVRGWIKKSRKVEVLDGPIFWFSPPPFLAKFVLLICLIGEGRWAEVCQRCGRYERGVHPSSLLNTLLNDWGDPKPASAATSAMVRLVVRNRAMARLIR